MRGCITRKDGEPLQLAGHNDVDIKTQMGDGELLYVGTILFNGHQHNHESCKPDLRRVIPMSVLKEASQLHESGGHTLGAIIRFLEGRLGLRVSSRSFGRRVEYLRNKESPRSREANRLLDRFS